MITSFNTSYVDSLGDYVLDRRLIFQNYVKKWFILDFISNFPLDWIF